MRSSVAFSRASRTRLAQWVALYLAVGGVVALLEPNGGQAPWYPPVAIGVMILLEFGGRVWPVVLACDVLVSVAKYDLAFGAGAVSGTVTALEILAIWALLRRFGVSRQLRRVEDVVLMALAGAIGALSAATVGSLLLRAVGDTATRSQWSVWAIGDLTGLTIVLPVLLLTSQRQRAWRSMIEIPRRRQAEFLAVGFGGLFLVFGYFVRVRPGALDTTAAGSLLLCLLPVFWIAVRFGRLRTAAYALFMDIAASLGFAGFGPHLFVSDQPGQTWDMATVQLPMFSMALASLGVAVSVSAAQRALDREKALVDASPVGIVSLDAHGSVTSWNHAAHRMFGYTADEAVGRIPPMLPPKERDEFRRRIGSALSGPLERVAHYHHKDGRPITARLFTGPLFDQAGAPSGVIGIIEDVTEFIALQERQALLNAAIEQTAESIVVTDLTGSIIYANPAVTVNTGYTVAEVLGQNPRMFKSGLHDAAFYREMWEALASGHAWSGVIVNRRKNGDLFHEQVGIEPVHDADGAPVAYVSVQHDLTVQRKLEADLAHDREMRDRVMAIMGRVHSGDTLASTAAVMTQAVVDVTAFDFATVLLQHSDGSLEVIGESGRDRDSRVGRILLPSKSINELLMRTDHSVWWTDAERFATHPGPWSDRLFEERLTAAAFAPMRWNGQMFAVLVVGVREERHEWIESERAMLGEIASLGGVLIGAQVDQAREYDQMRRDITQIVGDRAFHPVFQPYIDLQTGEVVGYEALTRFHDGTRPDHKIRDAWLAGLGVELEVVLATAALDAADRMLPGVELSVNFSPETILSGRAAEVVRGRERPVVVEVTEHTAIEDYVALRAALAACGPVKVSVDDAGAGFASLRHILELEPDVVKLDIGLIHGIDGDLARQALAAGMRHYAQRTGTLLIAEGVETEAEAATVRELGVHWGQGYYFGRPSRTG
jgi:PAS domain S-box-containing protein